MADPDPDVPFQWKPLHIQTSGTVTASDIAPFLDEVHKHHQRIELSLRDGTHQPSQSIVVSLPALGNEPPAADFTEIALVIAIPAGLYAKAFIEAWAAEDAKELRRRLIEAANKGVRKQTEGATRDFVPLQFTVGGTRYVVRELYDEEELQDAIRALPPGAENHGQPGTGEKRSYSLHFWDHEERRWG